MYNLGLREYKDLRGSVRDFSAGQYNQAFGVNWTPYGSQASANKEVLIASY